MTDTTLIPRRILFGSPAVCQPSLSPSGRYVTYLAPERGDQDRDDLGLWISDLDEGGHRPLAQLCGRHVEEHVWARDGRHLLLIGDTAGDERDHIIAVDLQTGRSRDLTPYPGVRAAIVGMQWNTPGTVLCTMTLRARDRADLYRLDLASAAYEQVPSEPGVTGWLTDGDLRVRAGRRQRTDGGFEILVRDNETDPWRVLLGLGYDDASNSQVLGFTGDGGSLLLLSPWRSDTVRLLRVSVATGDVEVLHGEPGHDVVSATLHPLTGEPDLAVVERDRTVLVPLADDTARDVARLRALTRGDAMPLGRDLHNRRWLVLDNVDDGPARYLLFDREAGTARELFTHDPRLAGQPLAKMEPFSFKARDGLTIHGYLTFPPSGRRNLPAVLNVHGGPWERNRWGYRAESQWLANRGYLCIEVNYRGSTGYGRTFCLAGDREWGGRMQDDLVDAVRWAVEQGYADEKRLGIAGASYGGYAALAGAAFTPELFRCAIAVAAPVNLRTFVASVPGADLPGGSRIARRVGDPDADAELLWARSPLSRVDEIRIPLLLAYGRNDPRVDIAEAAQLVAALQVNGVEHRCLIFDDEGHGFTRPSNVLAYRAAAESLLARHLGGRYEPPEPLARAAER